MPKRRTEGVVTVTDHRIQRRPPGRHLEAWSRRIALIKVKLSATFRPSEMEALIFIGALLKQTALKLEVATWFQAAVETQQPRLRYWVELALAQMEGELGCKRGFDRALGVDPAVLRATWSLANSWAKWTKPRLLPRGVGDRR
jgi:hypothetical protein